MLQGKKKMILTKVKLRTSEARTQKHEWESSCTSVTLFFLMHAQKWPPFLPETKHMKNLSQNIR